MGRKMNEPQGLNWHVAEELRGESAAQRVTRREMAERSGLSLASVNRYLTGRGDIGVDSLDKMALVLGLTASQIIDAAVARQGRDRDAVNQQLLRAIKRESRPS